MKRSAGHAIRATVAHAGCVLWLAAAGCSSSTDPAVLPPPIDSGLCRFIAPGDTGRGLAPGLIIGSDVLLPEGHRTNYAVHVRFNGSIGAVGEFDTIDEAYPDAAVLDCRGKAVLSPGFVNAHEHPAYSYSFPDANLNPNYEHRDEWRLGLGGKIRLVSPTPVYYEPSATDRTTALLVAMELRHLLGGATAIAGAGGVPGVLRNVGLQERVGDLALYDAEADVSTFPFSYSVVEDLREECADGAAHEFAPADDERLVFTAYVAHVGEGRRTNCAARAELARYLERVKRRDRRYSLVHGVAADRQDFDVMREFDVSLIWSPRSNLALYGQTVDIGGALASGVRVALATDWSPSGSFSLKEAFRCASQVALESDVALPSELLWRMATGNAAYALGLEDRYGAIKPGLRADLVLVRHRASDPYDAVLNAPAADILATWIDGRPVLLSGLLNGALSGRDCVAIGGVAPRVCGVLSDFGLSPTEFNDLVRDAVPMDDPRRQARCRQVVVADP